MGRRSGNRERSRLFHRRNAREPRPPRVRKPKEDRLLPRMFRFISSSAVEAVVTRFLGPASKKPMSSAVKLGGIAAVVGVGIAFLKGCG